MLPIRDYTYFVAPSALIGTPLKKISFAPFRHGREGGHPRQASTGIVCVMEFRPIHFLPVRERMTDWRTKIPCVYLIASKRDGVLYIGVTSDLVVRVSVHKQDLFEGFTKKYGVHMLVYYEMHETMELAIQRESQLKKWKRAWKVRLIQEMNPEWVDLYDVDSREILEGPVDVLRSRLG
ncbi:MAG: GIY-YIG nuclease family protein [Hyphomicrobiaceae bacterium]